MIHKTKIEIPRNTILKDAMKKSKHEQYESQPMTLEGGYHVEAPVSGSNTRSNIPIMVGGIRLSPGLADRSWRSIRLTIGNCMTRADRLKQPCVMLEEHNGPNFLCVHVAEQILGNRDEIGSSGGIALANLSSTVPQGYYWRRVDHPIKRPGAVALPLVALLRYGPYRPRLDKLLLLADQALRECTSRRDAASPRGPGPSIVPGPNIWGDVGILVGVRYWQL